LCRQRNKLLR